MIPKRQIMSIIDMEKWKKSKVKWIVIENILTLTYISYKIKAYGELINFVKNLNDSVKFCKISDKYDVNPVNKWLTTIMRLKNMKL